VPRFETLAEGRAVRILFPDRTDTVVLRHDAEPLAIDGQTITGAAVLVSTRGGTSTVTDFAAAP
jgi:hypothetical protein